MDKRGIYLQLYKRAPAPNRDYYGLTITKNEVILNIWNITHGPHVFPRKQKCPLGEFWEEKTLKADIDRLFGKHVVQYCEMLSRGDRKLECMPTKIFLYILRHLATNDILNLGQTSKIFFELCNHESAWKLLFKKRNKKRTTTDDIENAEVRGWKNVLLTKILLQDTPKSRDKPQAHVKATKLIKDINKSQTTNKKEAAPKNNANRTDTKNKLIPEDTKKVLLNLVPVSKKIPLKQKSAPAQEKIESKSNLTGEEMYTKNPFEIPPSFYQLPQFGNPGKPRTPFTITNRKSQSVRNLNNAKIVNECKKVVNNKSNLVKSKTNVKIIDNMVDLRNEITNEQFRLKDKLTEIREKNVNLKGGLKKTNSGNKGFSVKFK